MGSHRRPAQPGTDRSTRVTVLSAAAATAAAALAAAPAGAAPQARPDRPDRPADTRAAVDRLYEEAERATEAYNEADERTDELRAQAKRAKDSVARGQERINGMRGELGALAQAQYREGGIAPALLLMLSSDPDGYLDRAAVLDRVTVRQAGELTDLQKAQRGLARERAEAGRKLAELEKSRATVARHKRAVEHKLATARRLLDSLTGKERRAYDRASRGGGRGDLPEPAGTVSSRAAAALAAARSAVGRPYVWGANGPSGFDCSGLTQWSYAQAGVGLPRTSQAQRYAGRQVSLSDVRPGDLVAYRDDASHIGMYAGDGQVVHAPYPGAPVRYDPVGMMPVSSVTRI
ncbi:NlpC/P60 family protein [Streptomyces sp. NPDC050703]|uniref:C40 family peptidase n=1 Tax=Streptomyces sp. NPDC050703 TaxID=3157218 RepID=UPI00344A3791